MAHPEQRQYFERIKAQYPEFFDDVSVLEVGSLNINGTVRGFYSATRYVGVDVGAGHCVDVVCRGEDLAYVDGEFDVCVSAECFEHNPEWLATFRNMIRIASKFVIFTCATEGRAEHGTASSSPGSSPLTAGSNYYRNLTRMDFEREIDFSAKFSTWEFSTDDTSHDLQFFGVKRHALTN